METDIMLGRGGARKYLLPLVWCVRVGDGSGFMPHKIRFFNNA